MTFDNIFSQLYHNQRGKTTTTSKWKHALVVIFFNCWEYSLFINVKDRKEIITQNFMWNTIKRLRTKLLSHKQAKIWKMIKASVFFFFHRNWIFAEILSLQNFILFIFNKIELVFWKFFLYHSHAINEMVLLYLFRWTAHLLYALLISEVLQNGNSTRF